MDNPIKEVFWFLKKKYMNYAKYNNPRVYISIIHHDRLCRWINWKNPKDLNEKINWLKFYSDTSMWTRCADKYRVREYVKECGCPEILVPLYGVWENAADIDLDKLPEKFVLKPNHGCGDVFVVKDKSEINFMEICNRLQKAINTKFGYELAEWHYLNISPCIICEKNIKSSTCADLIDYKIWCFDGVPYYVLTCSERDVEAHKTTLNLFDLNWNRLDNYMTPKYRNDIIVPKPVHLDKMLNYAKMLSKPFPEVRVDFYEVDGMIYFGELTFTSRSGLMDYFTEDCLLEMGSKVTLPTKNK